MAKLDKKLKKIWKLEKKLNSIKSTLLKLADDKESLVRCDAVESLAYFYDGDIDRKILERLEDRDNLVRVTALESIILPQNIDRVFKKIAKNLNSSDVLVRAYAVDALAYNNAKKYRKKIKKLLKKEKSDEVLVRIYYAMVKFGDKKYLQNLINLLKSREYVVRIVAGKYLYYLTNKKNHKMILKKLKESLKDEKIRAVKFSIKEAIEKIENREYS